LSLNFLKLCKSYYYNFNLFHHVIPEFIAQTGDPTDSGSGGSSIWNTLPSTSPAYQKDPYFVPPTNELGQTTRLKHAAKGTLSMALAQKQGAEPGTGGCGSQFFLTLGENLDYLDGKHAVFGKVVEGFDTLDKVGESLVDQEGRPLRDIRIRHVIVLGKHPHPLPLPSISEQVWREVTRS
jgi:peptidyl-prolyl cis-trans isomerase-like 4